MDLIVYAQTMPVAAQVALVFSIGISILNFAVNSGR
jgi:hypothetical protein